MLEKSIFREAALERLSTPDRLDQGLVIVNSAGGIALAALLVCIVAGPIWAATIRVPIMVSGQGITVWHADPQGTALSRECHFTRRQQPAEAV